MYIQGRMRGWFNRHFACARLVAPVKKLAEGRAAPDVRHVAAGETERRAAERAVVGNMKEAYVSEHACLPALIHAFHTSIKASVGLEVRVGKRHAYIAFTHAMHHHTWTLLKHCMRHMGGYWLRNCLPSEVDAFAEAVDASVPTAVERVL
eukprot:jgi/Tetstr1/430135/TSEL_019968.t1